MNKRFAIALVLAICLSLCACTSSAGEPTLPTSTTQDSAVLPATEPVVETDAPNDEPAKPEAIPVKCGESIDTENFLMTFDSIELLPEFSYSTSEYSSTSLYVENGYKLLMVRGHFENRAMVPISDSSFHFTAVVNGEYVVDGFDVRLNFFRDKYFEIDPYTDLDYVLYINIPEKLAEQFETVTFTLGFKDDMSLLTQTWNSDGTVTWDSDYEYALTGGISGEDGEGNPDTASAPEAAANTLEIGQLITTDEYEFTLTKVELTYEVLPPNASSVYSSYVAESGKVFIHVAAEVKNTMTRDIRIEELFTAEALYDGKYPYSGFTVVDDDNRFDWVGSYVAATPLETCVAHSLIECPVEVDTSGKSIVVTLELGGTEYTYVLR